ncbi:MAG: hypothetical protein JJ863_23970 [Deltaproteobacteria bacterium]|nr:hypothetical protein [Deltaproteobacteria bacterium]
MLTWWAWVLIGIGASLLLVRIHDLVQRKDALLRNFPIVGHLRQVMIVQRPKLRQYAVARNDEERPFTRDQRSWVARSAAKENHYFRFGTDKELEQAPGYLILKQNAHARRVGLRAARQPQVMGRVGFVLVLALAACSGGVENESAEVRMHAAACALMLAEEGEDACCESAAMVEGRYLMDPADGVEVLCRPDEVVLRTHHCEAVVTRSDLQTTSDCNR